MYNSGKWLFCFKKINELEKYLKNIRNNINEINLIFFL